MKLALLAATAAAGIAFSQVRNVDPPALANSGMPYLAKGPNGAVYLSWIDPLVNKEHALRFSRWQGSQWSAPETIAQGNNWFVNWADFPSLAALPDGSLLAHWLTRAGTSGSYGYGIRVAKRDPNTSAWRQIHGLSLDEPVDYAGFLTFVPGRNAAIYLSPPPKPENATKAPPASPAAHGHENHEADHRKTVRFISFRSDGTVDSDQELDPDACSCCQTAIGQTKGGLIAAYRDHLPAEIRDISVTRFADGVWTAPKTLHPDGWQINGCPTDGPAISAAGSRVAIVWLTRAGGAAKVQAALSADEGRQFSKPVRIDGGNPLGRPAITAFDDRSYLVTWLEKSEGSQVAVRLKRISPDGANLGVITVAQAPAGRTSGFPKVAVTGEQILLTWRDERVRAAVLTKQDFAKKSAK